MSALWTYLRGKLDWQHFVLVLAFAATTGIPDIVNVENAFVWGQFIPVTMKIGSYLVAFLALVKQATPGAPSLAAVKAARVMVTTFALVLLFALLTGCMSSAPIVAVTPSNSAQVSSCQSIASTHNDIVIGDFVLGGSTTVIGAVGALEPNTNASLKTGLAVAAAITGGVGLVGTALTGFTASEYSSGNCGQVVGSLPTASKASP